MLTTGNQLKAARALAGINQVKLARLAGVNPNTISAMERCGSKTFKSGFETVCSVMVALEKEGCQFFSRDGVGVAFGKPSG